MSFMFSCFWCFLVVFFFCVFFRVFFCVVPCVGVVIVVVAVGCCFLVVDKVAVFYC